MAAYLPHYNPANDTFLKYYPVTVTFANNDRLVPDASLAAKNWVATQYNVYIESYDPPYCIGNRGDVFIREHAHTDLCIYVKTEGGWTAWPTGGDYSVINFPGLLPKKRVFCPNKDGKMYHGRSAWNEHRRTLELPGMLPNVLTSAVAALRKGHAVHPSSWSRNPEDVVMGNDAIPPSKSLQVMFQASLILHYR